MTHTKKIAALVAGLALLISSFSGCAKKEEEFTFSSGLTANGRWEGVEALQYVELPDYEGIAIPADVHEIPDEQVDASVDELVAQYKTTAQVTDRAVRDADTVNIDYVGSVDGVEFDGGSTGGNGTDVTIGVTSYIDDFLEQLIGHRPGETFDIHVTFPDDYGTEESGNAHLNGKDAVFVTTVNHIVEQVDPVLSDGFVHEKFFESKGWETVADMRSEIRDNLKESAVMIYLQDYIIDFSAVIDVPESMLTYQEKSMVRQYADSAAYYGMTLEEFLPAYAGVESVEELWELNKDSNTRAATFYLVVQAIAEDADIVIKDADLKVYFEKYAGSADYTQYKDYYGKPYLMLMVQVQTVLDMLADQAAYE